MRLILETLSISLGIIILSFLPLFSKALRRHAQLCFLLGTGALSGILFFDLLPDLFAMGGSASLWPAAVVFVAHSLLHLGSHRHHDHVAPRHIGLFLASMIAHCLASGIMLAASTTLAEGINRTVFLALVSHKAYESLTVATVLVESLGSRARAAGAIALYALALPTGVILTFSFRSVMTPHVALLATSLAAGTLLGCLIFDFLLPSFARVREKRTDLGWVIVGLGLTQLVMKFSG